MTRTDPARRLLIVEDDPGLQSQMKWCFGDDIAVFTADDESSAMEVLRRDEPQVITLDLGLPPDPGGASVGMAILGQVLTLAPRTKVIVITGREEHGNALEAIGAGAWDYYQKPIDNDTLQFVVERAFRIAELEAENDRLQRNSGTTSIKGLIGSSQPMLEVCQMIEKIAATEITALVLGETGTGKELVARALHDLSPRAQANFAAINCAAIPENLLESELFGYERGAFTGATSQRKGKIESANGGTLFLDEIGDMPLALQAKLLRFLQERVIERLGGKQPIPVDVRVVCATHRDLAAMIADGTFREDLFYRVGEIKIAVPPLRARDDDVLLIGRAIAQRLAQDSGRAVPRFSQAAIDAMRAWHWPGNVRELENRVKRAVIMSEDGQIQPADLELAQAEASEANLPLNLREARELAEQQVIRRALGITGDNIAQTARLLGVTRPTLYNLLSKYDFVVGDS